MQAKEVAERLSESSDLDLDPLSRAQLRHRAEAILATEVLSTTAVATDLQTQNSRNFQSAKIVTDIRPVFDDEVQARPRGAVIVETLQIQTKRPSSDRAQRRKALRLSTERCGY
jgi:hypothetical protein